MFFKRFLDTILSGIWNSCIIHVCDIHYTLFISKAISNYMHISCSSTRESTPCDLIRGSDTIGTPGSSTRPARPVASNQRSWNMMQQIPTSREMEEFFAFAQQEQQRLFTEKYVTVSTILIW